MSYPFDPDWVVAPGETLDSWFSEQGLVTDGGRAVRAERFGIRATQLSAFLHGGPLTGISRVFWQALEHNFRVGLADGKTWSRA